jgi:hypothetical protein
LPDGKGRPATRRGGAAARLAACHDSGRSK